MHDPFSTHAAIKYGVKVFLGISLLALVAFSLYWYFTFDDPILTEPQDLDTGLTDDVSENILASGYLYAIGTPDVSQAGLPAEVGEPEPEELLFTYEFATDEWLLEPSIAIPSTLEALADNPRYGYFLYASPDFAGTIDDLHPAYIDYTTGDIEVFNTPSAWSETLVEVSERVADRPSDIAYAAIPDEVNTNDKLTMASWSVYIHTPATDETTVIEEAVSPVWFNNGADVAFVKSDGVYRYNLASKQVERMNGDWVDLPATVRIDISADSSHLVMTVPSLGSVTTYQFADSLNGEMYELGTMAQAGISYFSPAFSPVGNLFAVVQFVDATEDTRVMVFETGAREVVDSIMLPFTTAASRDLLDWRATARPFAQHN